jgi:hypothetical protein
MVVKVDEQLRAEARRFGLLFACPSCVEFDPETGGCALGYPNDVHVDPSLEGREELVFCKAFELW